MPEKNNLKQTAWFFAALAGLTLALFWPATGFDFINYDDTDYVTYNGVVSAGLSWRGILWAFETNHASNWHPLTWISHMLDSSLFGHKPGGHHLTSLLLHSLNAGLLFLALKRLTLNTWRSALAAALFAWHPLRVESVAWVSERKDVLSAFFAFLALYAYAGYARQSKNQNPPIPLHKNRGYLLALFFFTCGLLSKPMVVTLPFLFMLLDFWPLNRLIFSPSPVGPEEGPRLGILEWVIEKIPFFALSLLDSLATFWAQQETQSVVGAAALPLFPRLANVLVGYVRYLGKIFWPRPLAIPYPFSHEWSLAETLGAAAILLAITAIALRSRRTRPHWLVGWLWFGGMLVPVIGLVQVGMQSLADRYTYMPSIGISLMLVWSIPEGWFAWPRPGLIFASAAAALLVCCATLSEMQLAYWRNSITLFLHTTLVTRDNILAEYNLGEALARAGLVDDGIEHYRRALAIRPNRVESQYNSQPEAHYNLGVLYRKLKKWGDAEAQFRAFILSEPQVSGGHINLGVALIAQNHLEEGLAEFRLATAQSRLKPAEKETLILAALDSTYAELAEWDKAIAAAQKTLEQAGTSGNKQLAEAAQKRMDEYKMLKAVAK